MQIFQADDRGNITLLDRNELKSEWERSLKAREAALRKDMENQRAYLKGEIAKAKAEAKTEARAELLAEFSREGWPIATIKNDVYVNGGITLGGGGFAMKDNRGRKLIGSDELKLLARFARGEAELVSTNMNKKQACLMTEGGDLSMRGDRFDGAQWGADGHGFNCVRVKPR
jgi:hypothetical protein